MKHISEILAERQKTLFWKPEEKGSREWKTFDVVRDEHIGMFPVRIPRRPVVTREAHHVLRISYPQPVVRNA